jgi:UDP-glucuronate 4-epimerase
MILITGAAGFIGFHLAQLLLRQGVTIIGVDNLNDYYDVNLKLARLEILKSYDGFCFCEHDICDKQALESHFQEYDIKRVVHLAAQAGVRYSLENPHAYIQSNVVGFTNLIECARHFGIEHFVYASTSSVYGMNSMQPYGETHGVDHPCQIYAATKRANELIAHSYSHLYGLPTTGCRFFTVYGPFGRPDMAFFSFTKNIIEQKPICVYNQGQMRRDFTYVDDIVAALSKIIDFTATADIHFNSDMPSPEISSAPFKIYNIGHGKPIGLIDYIGALETAIGKKAIIEYKPMQAGDVVSTHADTTLLEREIAYKPMVTIEQGIEKFVAWYKQFYQIS